MKLTRSELAMLIFMIGAIITITALFNEMDSLHKQFNILQYKQNTAWRIYED